MKKKVNFIILIIFILLLFSFIYWIMTKNKNIDSKKVIILFNWGEYINPDIIKEYNEKSKEFIVKQSFFSSNELAINKIKSGNQYDIAILSEYAIEQLKDNYLEKIQPQEQKFTHIFQKFQNKLDNQQIFEYTIPYFWGNLGFLYRKDKIDYQQHLSSNKWVDLLQNSRYKIALYNNAFEGVFVGLKAVGGDIGVNYEEDIQKSKEWLIQLKQKNNNLSFVTDQILDRMKISKKENYDIALVYSGDARYLVQQNSNLGYYQFDDEGTNIWFDGIVLPKGSQTKGAYDFIEFLLKEENRKKNNDFIGYDSPYDIQEQQVIKLNINEKDKIYKYSEKYKTQINDTWNEVYAYPDPKDKYLIILLLFIFILFIFYIYFFNI
ncbi:extracellular solute-binding protein [Candidatus Phytoplasma fraxini]|uniref:Spermidine/putrescine import ABC transporter substrate-binding protein (PotD) n=1 Tax=Ash yellows phytoplasma TaxID=35780 RepID=A0ABZ2U7Z5_ASHYP